MQNPRIYFGWKTELCLYITEFHELRRSIASGTKLSKILHFKTRVAFDLFHTIYEGISALIFANEAELQ